MEASEKLLAAFQIECVEHLEGIRASLSKLERHGDTPAMAELDEAFRRAHSLKGAARATGALACERLAHRLESLFSRVREGVLTFDKDTLCVVCLALDAIEDAAVCLAKDRAPADSQLVLDELDRVNGTSPGRRIETGKTSKLDEALRAAFDEEYQTYVHGIRSFLQKAEQHDSPAASPDLQEALRCAHTLKGAARIANVLGVDVLAQWLESLFAQVRQGQAKVNEVMVDGIQQVLKAIEDCMAVPPRIGDSQIQELLVRQRCVAGRKTYQALADGENPLVVNALAGSPPAASANMPLTVVETIRLSADSLDRLLQSTGELLTESRKQELVMQELSAMGQQIAGLESHWKSLKKAAGSNRQSATTSEVGRVRQGLDLIEHQLHSLSRHARSVQLLQQRSAWSLRLLGEQLQRDVRQTRMVPAESVFQLFRKMVRDLARDEGKHIEFHVSGFDVHADRMVLQALKDPLMHILSNAVIHGIEPAERRHSQGKTPTGLVLLKIEAIGNRLNITVEDDGRGIDLVNIGEVAARRRLLPEGGGAIATRDELTRFLFQPGFTTARIVTELSGRGIGLSVAYQTVTRLQGDIEIRQREGAGTVISLSLPLAIATQRLLLVSCSEQTFAIPLYGIESLHRIEVKALESVEGKPMVVIEGQLTSLTTLAQLLDIENPDSGFGSDTLSLVVMRSGRKRLAVVVDALLGERDALIKNLGEQTASFEQFSGGVLLEDGSVALVLNPTEALEAFRPILRTEAVLQDQTAEKEQAATILVVDDSFTTRTLETSILETHGYQVRVAVDGLEALSLLRSEKINLVITDIQMPHLDGFGLLEEIKKDQRLAHIPVIIVSSVDHCEDQQRGLNLGADAYIVKRKFDHQDLLQTIHQIL